MFVSNSKTLRSLAVGFGASGAFALLCALLLGQSGPSRLGETKEEVAQVMDDQRAADVDFLTIGQYLQPSRKHHPVMRYVPPEEFKALETIAYAKGFSMVSASPLTRSSHHAGEDFARLKAQRAAR